jgi:hypothetical protein
MKKNWMTIFLSFLFFSVSLSANNFFQCFGKDFMVEISLLKDPHRAKLSVIKDGKSTNIPARMRSDQLSIWIDSLKLGFSDEGHASIQLHKNISKFSTALELGNSLFEVNCVGRQILISPF